MIKFSLFLMLPLFIYAQDNMEFHSLDRKTSKLKRIENIETYLSQSNEQVLKTRQALIAQDKVIKQLQEKINDLVKEQIEIEKQKSEIQTESSFNQSELMERLNTIEDKVKQLNIQEIANIKKRLDGMDNMLKTIQDLVKTLEKRVGSVKRP